MKTRRWYLLVREVVDELQVLVVEERTGRVGKHPGTLQNLTKTLTNVVVSCRGLPRATLTNVKHLRCSCVKEIYNKSRTNPHKCASERKNPVLFGVWLCRWREDKAFKLQHFLEKARCLTSFQRRESPTQSFSSEVTRNVCKKIEDSAPWCGFAAPRRRGTSGEVLNNFDGAVLARG